MKVNWDFKWGRGGRLKPKNQWKDIFWNKIMNKPLNYFFFTFKNKKKKHATCKIRITFLSINNCMLSEIFHYVKTSHGM